MKVYDLLDLASRNLRESILRNGLTTAGIAVGVASLVAMLSLGVGLQELASERLSRSGLFDTIVISPLRGFRGINGRERNSNPDGSRVRVLDQEARREIARVGNVTEVQPEIRFLGELRYGDRSYFASIGGLPPSARENESFDHLQGRFFSGPAAREAIVRTEFAQSLDEEEPASVIGQDLILRYGERQPLAANDDLDSDSALGDSESPGEDTYGFSVIRREQTLRIVGILETEPFGGLRRVSRARVFIPTQLAEDLNMMEFSGGREMMADSPGKRVYSRLIARVSNPSQVAAVQESVREMGFRTFSILDATQGLRRFFTILDLFLGIFGSLALAVASLGIINTLVMAVLERRREIGILKALGASDGDVKKLFFAEAGAMGLVGGILGVALGGAIGGAINWGTNLYLERHDLPPETVWSAPFWLLGAAIAFAVVVSLAAGLYPAARAAKLDPVQALRYE